MYKWKAHTMCTQFKDTFTLASREKSSISFRDESSTCIARQKDDIKTDGNALAPTECVSFTAGRAPNVVELWWGISKADPQFRNFFDIISVKIYQGSGFLVFYFHSPARLRVHYPIVHEWPTPCLNCVAVHRKRALPFVFEALVHLCKALWTFFWPCILSNLRIDFEAKGATILTKFAQSTFPLVCLINTHSWARVFHFLVQRFCPFRGNGCGSTNVPLNFFFDPLTDLKLPPPQKRKVACSLFLTT